MHFIARLALLTFLIARSLAHDNGMVMNMDQGMSMNMGNMIMYLHHTVGDNLLFVGWAPRSAGAMVGTCIGIFLLAVAERWLAMMRAVMEAHWRTRAQISLANNLNTSIVATSEERNKPVSQAAQPQRDSQSHWALPLIFAYDVPRGIMQVVLASINILFMLTVMTFQIGFILAIVIGLGVGEALFGRYSPRLGHLH
ncbi:CTR copper uptake transporter [Lactifluus subvellereus]|nr:CTR copper uptake transporter [Lactifluus subvellereus]